MNKLNSKTIVTVIFGIIILFVALVYLLPKQTKDQKEFLAKYNLENLSVKQIVANLEHSVNEDPQLYAAITSTKLTLGDDNDEIILNIPSNEFYLSVAPYINTTHPCANHNLITCRGELKNQTMNVLVKDINGNIVINEEVSSYNNGFIGIWLPRNIQGTITISYNGLSATTDISTNSSSNTCLTSMKLS